MIRKLKRCMENKDIKISVIMPVYKVEAYIERAIKSVINSTLKELELFLIDDGSPDKSGMICDEYAAKDDRIKVIHQANQGAHIARNNALKEAKGKYVCFFDSDDYIDDRMLEKLYDIAEKDSLDLVVSGFFIETYFNDKDFITLDYVPESNIYKDKKTFRQDAYKYFDINMFYPPWNKLYRRSYLENNNITFPITYRDDFPFVLSVIKDIENIGFTSREFYHFIRKREESETQKYVARFYDKREEEHKWMKDIYKSWGLEDDVNAKDMIGRRYIDRLIECMVNLYNDECKLTEKEKTNEIYKYLHNENIDEALLDAKPRKLYLKLMYKPLKMKSVWLCKAMAKFIKSVKNKNIKMFSKLKKNR